VKNGQRLIDQSDAFSSVCVQTDVGQQIVEHLLRLTDSLQLMPLKQAVGYEEKMDGAVLQ